MKCILYDNMANCHRASSAVIWPADPFRSRDLRRHVRDPIRSPPASGTDRAWSLGEETGCLSLRAQGGNNWQESDDTPAAGGLFALASA